MKNRVCCFVSILLLVACMIGIAVGEPSPDYDDITAVYIYYLNANDLYPGQEEKVFLTMNPEQGLSRIKYKSSNTNVVKVDQSGKITAIGKGTATITATAENGVSGSCTVHVTHDAAQLKYALVSDGNGYKITGCDNTAYKVEIPASYNGLPVIEIGNEAFISCDHLAEFTVEQNHPVFYTDSHGVIYSNATGVKTLVRFPTHYGLNDTNAYEFSYQVAPGTVAIAPYAFAGIRKSGNIHLPDGLKTIGDYAFSYVEMQISVFFPDSVSSIGSHVLQGQKANAAFYAHEGTYVVTFAREHKIPIGMIRDEIEPDEQTAEVIEDDAKNAKTPQKIDINKRIKTSNKRSVGYSNGMQVTYDLKELQKKNPSEIYIETRSQWAEIVSKSGEKTINGYPPQTGLYGAGYTKGETWLRGYDLNGKETGVRKVSGDFIFSFPGAYDLGVSGGEDTALTIIPYKPVFVTQPGILPVDAKNYYSEPDGQMFQFYVIMIPYGTMSVKIKDDLNIISYGETEVTGSTEKETAHYKLLWFRLKDPVRIPRSNLISIQFDGMDKLYEDTEFSCYAKSSYNLDHHYGEKLKNILKLVKAEMTSYAYPANEYIAKVKVLVNGRYPSSFKSTINLDEYLVPYTDGCAYTVAHEMVHAIDQSYETVSLLAPSAWMEGRAEYIALHVLDKMNLPRGGQDYPEQYNWSFLSKEDKGDFYKYYYFSTNRNTTYSVGYYFFKYICDTYGKSSTGRIMSRLIKTKNVDYGTDQETRKKLFYEAVIAETDPQVFQNFVRDVIESDHDEKTTTMPEPTTTPEPTPTSEPTHTPESIHDIPLSEAVIDGVKYKLDNVNNTAAVVGAESKKVKTITIPATLKILKWKYKVTTIEANAFSNLSKLTTVKIGQNITTIGANAFSGCKKLISVTGGSGVKTIGDGAFRNCVKLAEVTVPSKVKNIGKNAFNGCKALKKITFNGIKLTEIGKDAFKNISGKAVFKFPGKKLKAYTKLVKAAGAPAKAEFGK